MFCVKKMKKYTKGVAYRGQVCYNHRTGEKITENRLGRMTLMKKALALVLACMMCFSCFAMAEGLPESTPANTLVVGSASMNGDFIDGFGSNAHDNHIKQLVHAYCDTFEMTNAGEYVLNETVVKEYTAEADEAGNKTYTFNLWDDLKWSDGSAITAKDYVGSLLWKASPKWLEVGASSNMGMGLVGYNAYLTGETENFAGVKLIDDYSFSVTISADELPYFYEYYYAAVSPICMAVYAPGVDVISDENGSHFSVSNDEILPHMQNVSATERFNPSIGCGPYKFISYENGSATCIINEHFKGDYLGQKPQLTYIVHKEVPQDTDVDALIAGEVDMLTGMTEGKKIEAAKAASDIVYTRSYFRNGYGLMAFACDFGPTADPNVRWALANLIDRNAIVDYALGGYGGTVHSQYGFAQWMYQEAGTDLEDELIGFNLNIEEANKYLDQTEWIYEADGVTPFDASKATADSGYFRHNANGEKLTIMHCGTDKVLVTDAIEIQYTANAPLAGVDFQITKSDFAALLDHLYYGYEKGDERIYHSFNLSTDLSATFDPYLQSFHSDKAGTWLNYCQVQDPELDELIMTLRSIEPGDNEAFIDAWIDYEVRWQQLMPQIPLFSNEYFDLAAHSVQGLQSSPFAYHTDTICSVYKVVE